VSSFLLLAPSYLETPHNGDRIAVVMLFTRQASISIRDDENPEKKLVLK
jgi:hypothetical protein